MAEIGRPRKYKSAGALRKAVDAYWASISYRVPAMVSTPTGEVDESGAVKWKTKLLTEDRDGVGKPKTVAKYLEPPSVAGLCLYLGISKSTWSEYRRDEALGPVVAYWDARYEAYLVDRLETGKHISGVIFNLEHNFGWKHRQEIGMDRETRRAVTASAMTMEEKRALLAAAAKDFAGDGGTPSVGCADSAAVGGEADLRMRRTPCGCSSLREGARDGGNPSVAAKGGASSPFRGAKPGGGTGDDD